MKRVKLKTSRRNFIKTGIFNTATLGLGLAHGGVPIKRKISQTAKSLRILILGGTAFTGPHLIKYALKRGHEVSIFNRGKTKPTVHKELFAEVEKLIGDRNDNLEVLKALLPYYQNKIKCVYIDPPYNTGNESWEYNDNVNSPKIKKWIGKVVDS